MLLIFDMGLLFNIHLYVTKSQNHGKRHFQHFSNKYQHLFPEYKGKDLHKNTTIKWIPKFWLEESKNVDVRVI